MFFRVRGRRIYLIHNYRDGTDRVRQRCLFRADLAGGLQHWLSECGWEEIRCRLTEQCPEIQVRWGQLRRQMLAALPLSESASPSRPRKRRVFDPSEPEAREREHQVQQQALCLEQESRWGDLAELLEKHYRSCPGPRAAAAWALALQRAGRGQEALERWRELPRRRAERYLNSALILWQNHDLVAATEQLLLGLNRNFLIGEALRQRAWNWDYWAQFGHLWDQRARNFVLSVMADHGARAQLRRQHEENIQVQRWLATWGYQNLLMERVGKRIQFAGDREVFYSPRWHISLVRPRVA